MAEEDCGLFMFLDLRHQSNDSVQLIGSHFSHRPGYIACRRGRKTECGCNLHPVCACSYPSLRFIPSRNAQSAFYTRVRILYSVVMLSPRFIPESVFYTQSVVRGP